nr:hypothetical protein [Tanacetum cinerariifolium]
MDMEKLLVTQEYYTGQGSGGYQYYHAGQGLGGGQDYSMDNGSSMASPSDPVVDESPVEEGSKNGKTSKTTSHATSDSVHGGLTLNEEANDYEEEVQEVRPMIRDQDKNINDELPDQEHELLFAS